MDKHQLCRQALKENWYIQGFNGLPIFLSHVGVSALRMKKPLGYEYTKIFLDLQDGYAEFGYLWDDLDRIWKIIRQKLAADPQYLAKLKRKYRQRITKHRKFFTDITETKLKKVSDQELIKKLQQGGDIATDSVNVSHIIEAIGVGLEKDFARRLKQAIGNDQNYNKYFNILTAPTQPSFFARELLELSQLAKLGPVAKQKALQRHTQKYFWLSNSYARARELSNKYFTQRLKSLTKDNKEIWLDPTKEKKRLIKKLNLDSELKNEIELIDFTTIWQDERKAIILKTIGYYNRVVKEVSRRTKIPVSQLYYLGINDVKNVATLNDVRDLERELHKRRRGVFFYMVDYEEYTLSGHEYRIIREYREKIERQEEKTDREASGTVAMTGTAKGRVVVCKGLDSLKKVRPGDVIVASMTRPEFMPALKKAAAIVTDEGGVTCHAAVVARELDIPAVIGTKNATKIFQDGMMVEVQADQGIVREIK